MLSAGKAAAARAAAAPSQRLAEEAQAAGVASLRELFKGGSSSVDDLVDIAKQARSGGPSLAAMEGFVIHRLG